LQRAILKNTRSSLFRQSTRMFGGSSHDDHHDDHHGDHDDHHHHVETADGNHKFLTPCASKKTMIFDGLKGSANHSYELDNLYRHHNDLPLTQ
jgi:hypothetical protein